jgi:glc operon protein GlcG
MKAENSQNHADAIILTVEGMVQEYFKHQNKPASEISAAICIIDETGNVSGKFFGNDVSDKLKLREKYLTAWIKASQVWITGMKTFDYEHMVFNNQINYKDFGIQPPDFIGWRGGQPFKLKDGTNLSIGFSGFSQQDDLEIVSRAVKELNI